MDRMSILALASTGQTCHSSSLHWVTPALDLGTTTFSLCVSRFVIVVIQPLQIPGLPLSSLFLASQALSFICVISSLRYTPFVHILRAGSVFLVGPGWIHTASRINRDDFEAKSHPRPARLIYCQILKLKK